MYDIIWRFKGVSGTEVSHFNVIDTLCKSHFKYLFHGPIRALNFISIRVSWLFPRLFEEEDNRAIMDEVIEDELKLVLHNF